MLLKTSIATGKLTFSETEAAACLGLTVEHFRVLVRLHLSQGEEIPPGTTFKASDLLVLSILQQQGLCQASAPV